VKCVPGISKSSRLNCRTLIVVVIVVAVVVGCVGCFGSKRVSNYKKTRQTLISKINCRRFCCYSSCNIAVDALQHFQGPTDGCIRAQQRRVDADADADADVNSDANENKQQFIGIAA